MTVHTSDEHVARRFETGWAVARRIREEGVRTCVPAVEDRTATADSCRVGEGNIVRGED